MLKKFSVFGFCLSMILLCQEASAEIQKFIYTGVVKSGHGVKAQDRDGSVFGKTDLEGEPFQLMIIVDDSKGNQQKYQDSKGVIWGSRIFGSDQNSPAIAVLTINGRSVVFGTTKKLINLKMFDLTELLRESSGPQALVNIEKIDCQSSFVATELSNPAGPQKSFVISGGQNELGNTVIDGLSLTLHYNPTMDQCQFDYDWSEYTDCPVNRSSNGRFHLRHLVDFTNTLSNTYDVKGELEIRASIVPEAPAGSSFPLAKRVVDKCPEVKLIAPQSRKCCSLGSFVGGRALDPSELASQDQGFVYTTHAGMIDLGHLHDLADMTQFIYDSLQAGRREFNVFEGRVKVNLGQKELDQSFVRGLAGAIAYADAWAHELATWGSALEDFSSFSPEDMPSNLAGIKIATAALEKGCEDYDEHFRTELISAMNDLGVQPRTVTGQMMLAIQAKTSKDLAGKWLVPGNLYPDPLRRNFDRTIWLIHEPKTIQSYKWLDAADFSGYSRYFTYTMYDTSPLAKTFHGTGITSDMFPSLTEKMRAQWRATSGSAKGDQWP